jgi:hypothetical protein
MSTMEDRDTAMTRDPAHGPLPNRGYAQQYGYGRPPMYNRTLWAETRPSFLTSEFMFTILGVIGIAITAATAADIDSRLATTLITASAAASPRPHRAATRTTRATTCTSATTGNAAALLQPGCNRVATRLQG